ncbi:MAG TPA: TPM domain-containing protein, partial [Chthoniobacterales bacterium]|nr:TPM domain-containing protein [Chthoniobacterales bacterium]
DRRNGAVLFVFVDDRKMFIQVGYGLEGVIPDITAFDITERNIKPRFRNNDYEGGLATGIQLLMQAARGEYKGTGKTAAEKGGSDTDDRPGCSVTLTILFIMLLIFLSSRRSKRRRGYRYSGMGGPFIGGWSGGGGGWSSGGWSSGGGGGFSGFSGGGGSFGGGGAGSDW